MRNSRFTSEIAKYIASALILGSGIGGAVALVISRPAPPDKETSSLIPTVRLVDAQAYNGVLDLTVSGSVVPYREIKVAAEVTGQIKTKKEVCQAGTYVKKGTILFEIDKQDYQLELKRIKAEVVQSEKMLDETVEDLRAANETLDLAKREFELEEIEYNRRKNLKGVISKSEVGQAKRAFVAAQSSLATRVNAVRALETRKERMKAAIELSKAQEAKAELNLKRTTVVAPADGVIVAEQVEEGEIVNRGTQLVLFEDTSKSEVKCSLTQSELNWIRDNSPGKPDPDADRMSTIYHLPRTEVTVYDQANPDFRWSGILERFDGIGLDDRIKTIPCRIVITNPIATHEGVSRPIVRGMFVKCKIEISADQMVGDGKRFTVFPARALQPGGYVWKVRKEGVRPASTDASSNTPPSTDTKPATAKPEASKASFDADRYVLVRQPVKVVNFVTSPDFSEKMAVVRVGPNGMAPNEKVVVTPIAQPTDGGEVDVIQEKPTRLKEPRTPPSS